MARTGKRITFLCGTCGSDLVTRDAWAEWNVEQQDWVLGAAYDYAFCHKCEEETRLVEVEQKKPSRSKSVTSNGFGQRG